MIRTQIQLEEEQLRQLRSLARREGVSLAEVVRRLVNRGLEDTVPNSAKRYERAARLVGALHDPEDATDLSTDHDAYLDGAFE